jgi:uncharacterized protein YdiU (UPF0061 family)
MSSFATELPELCIAWHGTQWPSPELLVLNERLSTELSLDTARLHEPDGVAMLSGALVPDGVTPVAMGYAGHQFGGYSPRLGDGRALLLGELTDPSGRLHDLHLKGSGRTPFARGGDGLAAVGPMLREYVISEAMHSLGIPTTRALAVVGTGEQVARETLLPGAVLARIAASHIRVGTFEYAARHEDSTLVRRLADYAIKRHYPQAAKSEQPYLSLYEAVVESQALLVAQWMAVGFVHGVMNTDNMAISGETIDYGPCAFMDTFDQGTVFSSIDHGGRYAFGRQPAVAQWNLARLAETLVPLIDDDSQQAVAIVTALLDSFPARFDGHWQTLMRAKLGLPANQQPDTALIRELLDVMAAERLDYTSTMRSLSSVLRGGDPPNGLAAWCESWLGKVDEQSFAADAMDDLNPIYIPRNHIVEDALTAATTGDLDPFRELLAVLAHPFTERPGLERYAQPAPAADSYVTYCGT